MTMFASMSQKARVLRLPSLESAALIEVVNFHQGGARSVIRASEDRRIGSRREGGPDGRLEIAGRREAGSLNLVFLGVSPVVVRDGGEAAGAVQLQHRISQRTR